LLDFSLQAPNYALQIEVFKKVAKCCIADNVFEFANDVCLWYTRLRDQVEIDALVK